MNRKHAITERLSALQSWRYGLRTQISRIEAVLNEHQFLDVRAHQRVLHLLKRVNDERITVTFVAEPDRGDVDLINALFFSDLPRPLLPSRIGAISRCVTQIRFDPARKTSIRVLPIESRESSRKLHELVADEAEWRSIAFDAGDLVSTTKALAALGETRRINLADAVAWGLHVGALRGTGGTSGAAESGEERKLDADLQSIDVPRWRHAIINLPHPLLDAGLVVLNIPGQAALASEPELRREWIPASDAVVSVISIEEGISKLELNTWREYLGGSRNPRDRHADETPQGSRFVAANRLERLRDPNDTSDDAAREWLKEIDKRSQELSELLHLDTRQVVAVSSQLALLGCFSADRDAFAKSRLYQLERSISNGLSDHRQNAIANEVVEALSEIIEAAQASLDSARYDALEGLRVLSDLHAKNENLVAVMASERIRREGVLAQAEQTARSLKPIHTKLGIELSQLVSPETTLQDIRRAHASIHASLIPSAANEALKIYFSGTSRRLEVLAQKIEEIRLLFGNAGEKTFRALDLGQHEVHPFATQRFEAELQKIRETIDAEFAAVSSLKLKRGAALAAAFEATVGERATRLFTIAERESGSWMKGVWVALDAPITGARVRLARRGEKSEEINQAQLALTNKIAELQASVDVIHRKHAGLAWLRAGLARWVNGDESIDDAPPDGIAVS